MLVVRSNEPVKAIYFTSSRVVIVGAQEPYNWKDVSLISNAFSRSLFMIGVERCSVAPVTYCSPPSVLPPVSLPPSSALHYKRRWPSCELLPFWGACGIPYPRSCEVYSCWNTVLFYNGPAALLPRPCLPWCYFSGLTL